MDTIVIGITKMIGTGDAQTDWNLIMATAMLAMLPPVAVVVLMQRWFVKGLVETREVKAAASADAGARCAMAAVAGPDRGPQGMPPRWSPRIGAARCSGPRTASSPSGTRSPSAPTTSSSTCT